MVRNANEQGDVPQKRSARSAVFTGIGILSPLLAVASMVGGSVAGYPAIGAICAMGFIILAAWSLGASSPDAPPRCDECGQVLPDDDSARRER